MTEQMKDWQKKMLEKLERRADYLRSELEALEKTMVVLKNVWNGSSLPNEAMKQKKKDENETLEELE